MTWTTWTSTEREMVQRYFLDDSVYLRHSSPLFATLAHSCAADDDITGLCAVARPCQPVGLLFLNAAYYLLLKSPDHELARYFPSMTDSPAPREEAFPVFREFCLERREELSELLSHRTCNTNLVGKASSLLPAVQYVARRAGGPLTMLEICCSAGLNLMFDHYHYDYGPAGRVGREDSPVQLKCKLIGSARPPIDSVPVVAHRVGIDLVKMDPTAPLDRLWMEAVLAPEWTTEREHLRAALPIRAANDFRTVIGDALDVAPPLLEDLPGSLCVLLSECLGQWSETARSALDQMLRRASRHRDIHRLDIDLLHNETPQTVRGRLAKLAANRIPIQQKSFPSRIEHTRYANGESTARVLAHGDGFGVWLDWHVADA